MTELSPIKTEAELCTIFMRDMNAQPGWTCYPETGGFDILAVHEDGRQVGVEAKLQLNAKVADQIMPEPWQFRYGMNGPDHRIVIVSKITDASALCPGRATSHARASKSAWSFAATISRDCSADEIRGAASICSTGTPKSAAKCQWLSRKLQQAFQHLFG